MSPIPDFNIGTAHGKIDIDSTGAVTGVGHAQKSLDGLQGGLDKASGSLMKTGLVLGGVGVAAIGGLGVAVNEALKFEQRMSAIKAVTSASGAEMDKFHALALKLGADTKYSAGEAAVAIEELAKAGVSTKDILGGAAKAVTDLAAAGEVDLKRAAEITANAMGAFAIEGKDAARVSDVFAVAANSSATDVDTLGQSLSQVSAVAHVVGLGFEDTISALELFAKSGLKGSDAGTSLKTMLLNLQPQTKKQQVLFKELGLTTDQVGPKITRMGGQALDAGTLFDKLSNSGDKNAKALSKVGIELDKGNKQFKDSHGSVLSFDQVTDIMAKKLPFATGKLNEMGLAMGAGNNAFFTAAGTLRPIVEIQAALQKATQGMTDAQKLWTYEQIGGTDAVRAFSIISGDATGQLGSFRGELKSQGQAGDTAKTKMDNFAGSLEQLRGSIQTLEISLGEFLLPILKSIADWLTKATNVFLDLPDGVKQFIIYGTLAVGVLAGLAGGFAFVTGFAIKVAGAIGNVKKAFDAVKAAGGIIKALKLAMEGQAAASNAAALGTTELAAAETGEAVTAGAAIGPTAGLAGSFWALVAPLIPIIAAAALFIGAFLFLTKVLGVDTVTAIGLLIATIFPFIGLAIVVINNWSAISGFFANLWNTVWGFFAGFIPKLVGWIGDFLGKLGGWLLQIVTFVPRLGDQFIVAIINFFASLPGKIGGFLGNIIGAIANWVGNMIGKAAELGGRFLDSVSQGFERVVGFFAGLPGRIFGAIGDLAAGMFHLGTNAIESMGRGIESVIGRIMDIAGKVKDKIVEKLDPRNWFSTPEEHYRPLWRAAFESIGEEARASLGQITSDVKLITRAATPGDLTTWSSGNTGVSGSSTDNSRKMTIENLNVTPTSADMTEDDLASMIGRLELLYG